MQINGQNVKELRRVSDNTLIWSGLYGGLTVYTKNISDSYVSFFAKSNKYYIGTTLTGKNVYFYDLNFNKVKEISLENVIGISAYNDKIIIMYGDYTKYVDIYRDSDITKILSTVAYGLEISGYNHPYFYIANDCIFISDQIYNGNGIAISWDGSQRYTHHKDILGLYNGNVYTVNVGGIYKRPWNGKSEPTNVISDYINNSNLGYIEFFIDSVNGYGYIVKRKNNNPELIKVYDLKNNRKVKEESLSSFLGVPPIKGTKCMTYVGVAGFSDILIKTNTNIHAQVNKGNVVGYVIPFDVKYIKGEPFSIGDKIMSAREGKIMYSELKNSKVMIKNF